MENNVSNRWYRIIATPYLWELDYNIIYQRFPEAARFSMTGEWAIITYKELPENPDFPYYTNDEIVQFIYNNWSEWNPIDSTQELFSPDFSAIIS